LPVATPQILQLVRADHHHRRAGLQQGLDDLPVRALDRHLPYLQAAQAAQQLAQPRPGVGHGEPLHRPAGGIDDRDRVIVLRPVDPGDPIVGFQVR